MAEKTIRPLRPDDFDTLMRLEQEVFGAEGESVLGPYYVRLCCDFYADSCFVVHDGEEPAGYVLSFVKGREAYCTTLAVAPAYQGTRVAFLLLRALLASLLPRCESCWFTVKEANLQARSLHQALGAKEVGVHEAFYGAGDRRLISRIDREGIRAAPRPLRAHGAGGAGRAAAASAAGGAVAGGGVIGAARAAVRLATVAGLAGQTLLRAGRLGGARAEVRHRRAALLTGAARAALEVHRLSIQVQGPIPTGPALLAANHLSYLDPLVVAAAVPCVPVSKSELAAWPVFGAVARRTGVLFVERSSAHSRLRVMGAVEQVLVDGALALNFPEGTTTDGSQLLPFRKGLFGVARRLEVPVVPVALRYEPAALCWTGDATFLPHYLRFAALGAATVRLTFGQPIPSRRYPTAEALAAAAHARTRALLQPHTEDQAWPRQTR
ncbi:MAG: GNAT family N-acetyltransferase [Anaeromyxobacter sp.]